MNLKKLFAGFTALSVVALSVAPIANIPAHANNAEDQAAYEWAYAEGLTTMNSFGAFMFENAITREQAARFLVAGSEALGISLSSDQSCNFSDLATADQSLVEFINEGCDLGIFKAQDKFNPKQVFTRAQAELTVARLLKGYDAVNDYASDNGLGEFDAAREILMDDNVVTVAVDQNSAVRRGHLLLMLYRLQDNPNVENPTTPVLPGHAEVSLVSSAGTQNVPFNANGVKVGTIKLTAGSNPTTVSSVVIERSGLGNVSDLNAGGGVWLANSSIVTDARTFSTSSQSATVKFGPSLKLAAGQSMTFDVMIALSGAVNSQHSFKVTNVNVSNGTASGAPISLGTVNTTSYSISSVKATVNGQTNLQAGKTNELFATIDVVPVKEASIKKVVLAKTSGSQDFTEAFANVKAYYKGIAVGNVSVTNDKIIVDGLSIDALANETIKLELKGDITYVGSTATFAVTVSNNNSSIVAIEKASNYGMPVTNPATSTISITGLDLKITKTTNGSTTVNPGASNVTLYEAEISSAAEFDVTKFWLKEAAPATLTGYSGLSDDKIILYVGGDDYEIILNGAGAATYNATSGFYFSSNSNKFSVEPGQKVKVKVVGSFLSNANPTDFRFTFGIDEIQNLSNNNTMSVSKRQAGDKVSVKVGTATLKNSTVAAPTTKSIYANAEQEIGRFALRANDDAMTLKEVTLSLSGSTLNGGDLDDLLSNVKLVNVATNEDISASLDMSTTNTIKFSGISSIIPKDSDANFKVVGLTKSFTSDSLSGSIQLQAGTIKLTRNSDSSSVNAAGPATFKSYRLGAQPPVVTLSKLDSSRFTVTIKNVDTEEDITLTGVKASVKVDSSNDGYVGTFCLNLQGSSNTDCDTADAASQTGAIGAAGTSATFVLTSPINLSKNGGEVSYEIYVDSSFINPSGLQALIQALYYEGTSENYNVVAQ